MIKDVMLKEEILTSILQLLLALALGFAIGFERKMRYKEAGIRTHTIVCVGACLYMIISKFITKGSSADPGRIAAQIVSGIGFIGAGMIFNHKQVVHGLTTAAGIWATAAIGMAVGAQMWIISIVASAVIILIQFIMHLPFKIFHSRYHLKLNILFKCIDGSEKEKVKALFGVNRFTRINAKKENGIVYYSTLISTDKEFTADDIYSALNNNDFIISITREDEEF
ncbi:MAG: MgtC/SapB family protein [Clostridiales bacterium]|nr:MgtC/SapB family protein [Clostridiales bacterium]